MKSHVTQLIAYRALSRLNSDPYTSRTEDSLRPDHKAGQEKSHNLYHRTRRRVSKPTKGPSKISPKHPRIVLDASLHAVAYSLIFETGTGPWVLGSVYGAGKKANKGNCMTGKLE